MCGIAGVTRRSKGASKGVAERNTEAISHRGPDQQGVFEGSEATLCAVRLKIIDLEGGDQPILSDNRDTAIVFNGEIYNHLEVRAELESLGHRFLSNCDTETVLRAGTAAIARGIARRAYEMAMEYANARRQTGVAIIEHGAVSDLLGAMAVRLAIPLPTSAGETQALAAKIVQTDAAVATTTDAVQVFGGTGYIRETGVEKLMRDAKYCQLFPEPNWVAQDELMRLERARRR